MRPVWPCGTADPKATATLVRASRVGQYEEQLCEDNSAFRALTFLPRQLPSVA